MGKTRKIELSWNNRKERLVLPVNPAMTELTETSLNQTITLLNLGEINLIGKRGLIRCSISGFFPSSSSPFYRYAKKSPMTYINQIKKWKRSGKSIRLIITKPRINLSMTIESFKYDVVEGDRDISYTIELSEYRFLNVSSKKTKTKAKKSNGLKERQNTKEKPKIYTVKTGDSLWSIAKKIYGSGKEFIRIYNANKSMLKKRNKRTNKYTIYAKQELLIP